MAADDSYVNLFRGFRSHDNYSDVFTAMLTSLSRELNLASVKSCLTFGPGEGRYEVPFIQKCAANVTKLIAVEPDHQSAELLKARLEKDLPDVDCQVVETDMQNWKDLDEPVDLVLMMHVLYYLRPSERKEFLKKVRKQWLTSEGRAIVVTCSRTKCPGNANEIYERLGTPLTSWEDIEADLLETGFSKEYAYEMQYMRDYSNPRESLLRFFQKHLDHPVTLDDVRNAIKELYPNGKSDQVFNIFAVFQRA